MKKDENKKGKNKVWIIIVILLLLIGGFLFWWFNRRFEVIVKYNNSINDEVLYVRYLGKINKDDVNEDLKVSGKTFAGWFETYTLGDKELEIIKKDATKEVCKEGFKISSDKTKCISEELFDFENTRIKKNTTIEAFWTGIRFSITPTNKTINVGENFRIIASISGTKNKTVTFTSSNTKIATVDSNGKVVGVKSGSTTIIAESNGIKKKCTVTVKEIVTEEPKKEEPKKDEGTISLKATDQCIIGTEEVKVSATVNNALDKTINWDANLKCYNVSKKADNLLFSRKGRDTMCRPEEELNPVVKATLNNGNSDSLKFTYEPTLSYTVYDGNKEIQKNTNGKYIGNNIIIKTSGNAIFTAKAEFDGSDIVESKTGNSVTIKPYKRGTVTIKTTCGQSSSLVVEEAIN